MKKATATFLCFILVSMLAFPAAGESHMFEAGEYQRNPQNSAAFTYHAAEMEHCIVAIADHYTLSTEEEVQLAAWVEEDAALLWNAFPGAPLQKPTMYLVGFTGRSVSFALGNEAFIASEDLFAPAYQVVLMQAMLGQQTPWLAEGCVTYAMLKEEDDNFKGLELSEYALTHDRGILALLPTRFCPELNSEDDRITAQLLAMSLVNDIITVDGPEMLTQDVSAERMAQWRTRADLPLDDDPDQTAYLRQFTYTFGNITDVTITNEHLSYTLNAGDAGLNDAAAVEEFIYRTASAREYLLAYLKDNASPDYAAYFAKNLNDIKYKCREPQTYDISWFQYPDTIILYDHFFSTYTMASCMLGQSQPLTVLTAGLCMYLDMLLPQSYIAEKIRRYAIVPDAESGWSVGYDQYCAWAGVPSEETFDMRTGIDALAVYENANETGPQLNLIQCCSLMYYLIDQHGLDTVLTYVRTGQTEMDAFGKPFNMLQKEWRLYLNGKRGGV